jgi:hypothetical protein
MRSGIRKPESMKKRIFLALTGLIMIIAVPVKRFEQFKRLKAFFFGTSPAPK